MEGGKYVNDVEALAMLDQFAGEPDMHRRQSDFYAYAFQMAGRPLVRSCLR